MSDITARQQRILDFIGETVRERGYPPTVREIGEAVGLTSSSSVHAQLANLERMGLLHKDPTKPRAMTLATDEAKAAGTTVPLLGRIAAGAPMLATEQVEDYVAVPADFTSSGDHFALRVTGRLDGRGRDPRRRPRGGALAGGGRRRRHRRRAAARSGRGRGHRQAPRPRRRRA